MQESNTPEGAMENVNYAICRRDSRFNSCGVSPILRGRAGGHPVASTVRSDTGNTVESGKRIHVNKDIKSLPAAQCVGWGSIW
jgi:hypothetical protein